MRGNYLHYLESIFESAYKILIVVGQTLCRKLITFEHTRSPDRSRHTDRNTEITLGYLFVKQNFLET